MRVLMVGTGSIGQRHMGSLRQLVPSVEFDVLREQGRSADTAVLGAVNVVRSLDEALGRQPAFMVIANPSSMHLRFLRAAIENGVPFYAEKPVVSTTSDLAELHTLATSGRPLPTNLVGCNLRFLPSLRHLHALVHDGHLGRVAHASFEAGQWLPDWRPSQDYRQSYSARSALGGGVLLDLIHETDAARWLLGTIDDVQAHVARGASLEIETEDTACLLMKARSGTLATLQLDYISRRPFRRYRLVGDKASAEWDLPSRTLTVSDAQGAEAVALAPDAFDVGQTYLAAMRHFLQAVADGTPTAQPLSEGLAALDIVFRARAQPSISP